MIENLFRKISHSKPRKRAGLDIGSHAVKIVEISQGPEKTMLVGLGSRKVRGLPKEKLADSIKALAEEIGVTAKDFNISVSGPSVIVRLISMPKMTKEDLKGAIRFEAEKFIPFDIKDCILDFQILKKDDKTNKLDILLAAAKKDYIEERMKLVESAGYSISVVDVDSFALINSFLRNLPTPGSDKTIALLNIGAALTNLSIIKGDTICLVRDVMIGGNDFDNAISKSLSLDIGAVEELKSSPKEKLQEVVTAIKPVFNNLLDEVRLSCSYYENQCGRNVDEFYLSGGNSLLAGSEEMFQEAFNVKPSIWDPMQFLDISSGGRIDKKLLKGIKGSFAVAVGLALR